MKKLGEKSLGGNEKPLYVGLLIIGITIIIVGVIINPYVVSKYVSIDGTLEKLTVIAIYALEAFNVALGFVVCIYALSGITDGIFAKRINENVGAANAPACFFVSVFLATVLAPQAIAIGFRLDQTWPWTDYPMYEKAKYEGQHVNFRFPVFATLTDSTEVEIFKDDVHLPFWHFHKMVDRIRQGDRESVDHLADLYQTWQGKRITRLRVENYPVIVTRQGMKAAPADVLKIIRIDTNQ